FGARLGFPFFPALQHGHDELLLVGVLARVLPEQVLQGIGLSRVVDHLCDRGCDRGLLEPSLQLRHVLLGEDPLARAVRDSDATNAENGEQVICSRLGFPFFPALQHGHDELLLVGVLARVLPEQVLEL
ncbi:MAG TPA: hypothetical protein VF516_32180, partial [Kofleriaceae bacterium]